MTRPPSPVAGREVGKSLKPAALAARIARRYNALPMDSHDGFPPAGLAELLRAATGASAIAHSERLQTLWSGYGEIRRVALVDADVPSVVVKLVNPPGGDRHPRGWNSDRAHRRKLRSYAVEMAFYRHWSTDCGPGARVPGFVAGEAWPSPAAPERWWFVLEDLDASGFAGRRATPSATELRSCLTWLAHFHAAFMGRAPTDLWETGTYWHLATRPDELAAMGDGPLRAGAAVLDARLNGCRFQTLVHGDAKAENFCFGARAVAAVDFQYVGGGCGMKDVAYLFSSCLSDTECEAQAPALLDGYFAALRDALATTTPALDATAIEREWRSLYPVAWADFHRFLAGWAPGHWKIHRYTREQTRLALEGEQRA